MHTYIIIYMYIHIYINEPNQVVNELISFLTNLTESNYA